MAEAELDPIFTGLRGRIGDLVYYTVKNKTFSRKYVVPRNPKSRAQVAQRTLFADAMSAWKLLPEETKLRYMKRARRLTLQGHNIFVSEYIEEHRNRMPAESGELQYTEPTAAERCSFNESPVCQGKGVSPYMLRIYLDIDSIYIASTSG